VLENGGRMGIACQQLRLGVTGSTISCTGGSCPQNKLTTGPDGTIAGLCNLTWCDGLYGTIVAMVDAKSKSPALGQKHTAIAEELHCKRCGGGMELVTVLDKFGERPRFKIFCCGACGFCDWIKA
jgi:hypothetical protein